MSHLFEVLPLAPRPEPEKPPAEAFEAMEEEAATVQGSLDGILPCEKPRVEVWLADGEGVAIADVDTTLLLGGKHDGKLDGAWSRQAERHPVRRQGSHDGRQGDDRRSRAGG